LRPGKGCEEDGKARVKKRISSKKGMRRACGKGGPIGDAGKGEKNKCVS